MKNLIPHFIQDRFKSGQHQGNFEAYAMFIDLSGFTPLTEALMREGNRGAEQLSIILNEIFGPLVELVYAKGGFIPYFAGDSFTAIFPQEDDGVNTIHFVQTAILVKNLFTQREFRFGNFQIGLKIGLSHGAVEWGIVGKENKSFYFRGASIDNCAQCQIRAKEQDIVLDKVLKNMLGETDMKLDEVEQGYYRISGEPVLLDVPDLRHELPGLSKEVANAFLPEPVVEYQQDGEFRMVIAVFISFSGVETHELLDLFVSVVLDQINKFSGYFKEIDFGDKGGVLFGFFGAPVSFENNMERALEFITASREELRSLQEHTSLKFRLGATVGTAYTGIVGGKERCQYAAVGNRVNLAARLMTYADWGEVLIDEELKKNRNFDFQFKGDIKYKGIKGSVPTFKLIGRNHENQQAFSGQMVGRNEEIAQLKQYVTNLLQDSTPGIAYIYGEAGIGKSRLSHELKEWIKRRKIGQWFTCQADQILKKPFNPFTYFLKNYFYQSPDSSNASNLSNFEKRFNILLRALNKSGHAQQEHITRELIRTKSVLAALIGLSIEDSIWEHLDAKGRYQNTLAAINNLIIAESCLGFTVIELEDGHWIDDNSRELLYELVRNMQGRSILLLITSRYKDDGSKPLILNENLLVNLPFTYLEINLNILQPEAVRSFAEVNLGGKISDGFYEFLIRTTNSNPFYLEQVLEYFSESNLLTFVDGAWDIKDQNIRLSSSINAILTARIDRLSTLVKETVKAAAVIGREFEVPVLSEVMRSQNLFPAQNGASKSVLKEQIQIAEQGQIWLAMNELRYIFRHSLLREAVYSMQLRTRIRQLHGLIAEAIEKIYKDKLEERYFDLAFHYEQAGFTEKTCEYLKKAADYAKSNYQNQLALEYYERLLKKLGRLKDSDRKIRTHLKRGKVLELIGQWDECEKAYERALTLAKKSRDVLMLGQANDSLGRLLLLKGDYLNAKSYLQTAVQLFESIDDQTGISNVFGNLGNLHFRQGQYDEAKSYFERSIAISNSLGINTGNAQIVANLGLTHMNQGNFDEGIRWQEQQLEICKENNDKQGMATLYTNVGIVYFEKGDYDKALDSYMQGLELSEELGNKLLTSIAIGCIGSVYERKGDYEQAMENFERDLHICEELGDKQGTAIALGLIGELMSVKGDFHSAIEYLQKNLMLCEELGYQKGIAKAVNTLGDVFYYTKQYDRSIHYYDRAIEVTRSINNKLVLGFSLVEKGTVLIEKKELEPLKEVFAEALEIAKELGNPDLLFEAKILAAKALYAQGDTDEATGRLNNLLEEELDSDHEAAVNYELFRIKDDDLYRDQALVLYRALYHATPKYIYKTRIDHLAENKIA